MSIAAAVGARVLSASSVLADPTDVGDETHKGGPIAILVIAVLCIVCFFLFRSMSKHLRNVRGEFPGGAGPDGAGPDGASVAAGSSASTTADAAAGTPATPPAAPGSVRPAPKSRARTDHPADR